MFFHVIAYVTPSTSPRSILIVKKVIQGHTGGRQQSWSPKHARLPAHTVHTFPRRLQQGNYNLQSRSSRLALLNLNKAIQELELKC